jgi:hypothetical protein
MLLPVYQGIIGDLRTLYNDELYNLYSSYNIFSEDEINGARGNKKCIHIWF